MTETMRAGDEYEISLLPGLWFTVIFGHYALRKDLVDKIRVRRPIGSSRPLRIGQQAKIAMPRVGKRPRHCDSRIVAAPRRQLKVACPVAQATIG